MSTCIQATCIQVTLFFPLGVQLAPEKKKATAGANHTSVHTSVTELSNSYGTAERNRGTKSDWMFYLSKNTLFYVEKSYLCSQHDIFSSIQMHHGSLFKLRQCGKYTCKAIAIQCQHFNACSTGPSTVGWKRGIKLLVCNY